ncbi:OLC1v1027476C1 [Oldenlandia corymbosa var. corymbosa]|uniref:OLC1v1027476C1 n=1 Tax=Oldenlandia corymbosa var. corymbosa TaxID=529605 RepID=A0AAV1C9K4_OLDCO|nr:OLC1v1027476C1 [Oldenlandia corymbosa var. corymbosa]
MATPASRLIQDQNLNIHSTGTFGALGGKVDVSKATKKGALGGRRALNDISNSGKPSATQPSTKNKFINAGPTGKDLGANKAFSSKNQEKGKASGRKALSDLTNNVKPPPKLLPTKSQEKKVNVAVEANLLSAIKEEGFLHNHEECLKAQRKTMSFDYFLETVGLNGSSLVIRDPWELQPESPVKHLVEMDDIPMMLKEDEVDKNYEAGFLDSPKFGLAYDNWKDEDYLDFKLIASPKHEKF